MRAPGGYWSNREFMRQSLADDLRRPSTAHPAHQHDRFEREYEMTLARLLDLDKTPDISVILSRAVSIPAALIRV